MSDLAHASSKAEWRANWTLVAAAGAGVSLSAVSSSSLGVMMLPIERDLGWSRVEISLGVSLVSLIAMTLATAAGLAIDKLGPRIVGLFAATLMCVGIALMSAAGQNVWTWWALWALVGVASACMPTVWIAPVSSSFVKGRGLAIAITLCGSGISTSLVPVIANALVEGYGWRAAYVGIAGIWAVTVLPLALLFFRGGKAGPAGSRAATVVPAQGLTARQGFRSITFYKLALAAFLSMSAGVALILNLVPVLRSNGLEPATAAAVAGLIGIATIAGRVMGGWVMDRFDAGKIAAVSSGGAIVLPAALLLFPTSATAAAAGILVYGLLGGAKVPAVVYLASRHFGSRAFGVLYGAVNTMIALGVGLGPLVANYVYDVSGSYVPVMWAAVPFLILAAVLYASLGRYPEFAQPQTA